MPSASPVLDPLDPLLLESHPGLLRVKRYPDADERFLVVEQAFDEGETLCYIEGWIKCVCPPGPDRSWRAGQRGCC